MGNQLTQPSRLAAAEAVADLGGSVTYKDSLGGVPPLSARRHFGAPACVSPARPPPRPPPLAALLALQVVAASSRARCVCTMKAAWWWSRCATVAVATKFWVATKVCRPPAQPPSCRNLAVPSLPLPALSPLPHAGVRQARGHRG